MDALPPLRIAGAILVSASRRAVVIGGGPAGAAVAIDLARAGREVILLEREAGPRDKVCGEFLSREAVLYLADLGIDLAALGAVPITAARLAAGERVATAPLPFRAMSVSRRILDEALLQRAAAAGADLRRGARVRSLVQAEGGWTACLDQGAVSGTDVFLATGKHDLRGWKRPPGRQADLVGFKLHWRLAPTETMALDGCVELALFPHGYAGLELVEDGRANLCLVVRRAALANLGGSWDALLASARSACRQLDRRLLDATPCWPRPLAISAIPYGYVRRDSDGPWCLGDQAAVIPSFSGDGMSIALHSARLAARGYLAGESTGAYQQRLAGDLGLRVRAATLGSQALVRPWGQTTAMFGASLLPGLIATAARATRVPEAALQAGLDGCVPALP